jgi:hypothetical protein
LTGVTARITSAANRAMSRCKAALAPTSFNGDFRRRVHPWSGDDTLRGGGGNDILFGWPGDSQVDGGPGVESCLKQEIDDGGLNCEHAVPLRRRRLRLTEADCRPPPASMCLPVKQAPRQPLISRVM